MTNRDCFAYLGPDQMGIIRCDALRETLCEEGGCPFYKTTAQNNRDAAKAAERLRTIFPQEDEKTNRDAYSKGEDGMTCGERIRHLREELGKRQIDIQHDIGLNRKLTSRYECGTQIPAYKNAAMLARYFGVGREYLLYGDLEDKLKGRRGVLDALR